MISEENLPWVSERFREPISKLTGRARDATGPPPL
jgi:hypothetical protein